MPDLAEAKDAFKAWQTDPSDLGWQIPLEYAVALEGRVRKLEIAIQTHRAATPVSHPYNVRSADRALWALAEPGDASSEDQPK